LKRPTKITGTAETEETSCTRQRCFMPEDFDTPPAISSVHTATVQGVHMWPNYVLAPLPVHNLPSRTRLRSSCSLPQSGPPIVIDDTEEMDHHDGLSNHWRSVWRAASPSRALTAGLEF
jgi:hypothetical protein